MILQKALSYRVAGWLGIIYAAYVVCVGIWAAPAFISRIDRNEPAPPPEVTMFFASIFGAVFLLVAAWHVLIGVGTLRHHPWARFALIATAVILIGRDIYTGFPANDQAHWVGFIARLWVVACLIFGWDQSSKEKPHEQ